MIIKKIKSNTDILIDNNINIKNKNFLVLSLVKNIENSSFVFINDVITNLIQQTNNTKFCFVVNNCYDRTISLLNRLAIKHGQNNIKIIVLPDEDINIDNRINILTKYRNINFECGISFFGTNFDYVIVFDSDLYSHIPINELLNSIRIISPRWSCISGNHCYNSSSYYYDELALRFLDDPIDITQKFPDFIEHYGYDEKWLKNLYIVDDWIKVKSAFGGISIYHMQELLNIYKKDKILYNINDLPPFTAEHIALNIKLNHATLINPNIRYINSTNIEGKMYNHPTAFVPRDAGFFSVFNFYIGCLTQGSRSYPLWNKNELLNLHHTNQHFAYWTENFNCWYDYFEPVSFYPEDSTHLTDEYLKLPRYSGEHGPEEFRIPHITQQLLKGDSDRFKKWRNDTHEIYKKYVYFKQEITDYVESFWQKNFVNTSNIIGLHYRHPSHFVESGKISLSSYFNSIDHILLNHPDSKIFLASDSQFGIYTFMERYKDKIYYIDDIDRLTMSEFLDWAFSLADGKADHVGFVNGKGYELHHQRVNLDNNKKMTTDLLKEVLCLSRCNQVIGSVSNIPLAISYINPQTEIIIL